MLVSHIVHSQNYPFVIVSQHMYVIYKTMSDDKLCKESWCPFFSLFPEQ